MKKQDLRDRIADLEWQVEYWKKAAVHVEGVRSKERAHIAALERRVRELEIDARDYKREADHLREMQQPCSAAEWVDDDCSCGKPHTVFKPDAAVFERESGGEWQMNAEGVRQLNEYIENVRRLYGAPPTADNGWQDDSRCGKPHMPETRGEL